MKSHFLSILCLIPPSTWLTEIPNAVSELFLYNSSCILMLQNDIFNTCIGRKGQAIFWKSQVQNSLFQ